MEAQLFRYRGVGTDILEQSRQRVVIVVGDAISDAAVEELVAVEQQCCPFFRLDWEPNERRLSISVSGREDEPALGAIVEALG